MVELVHRIAELRATVADWRRAGETVALIPTMGALHAGHVSLVKEAQKRGARIALSVFVNPKQFGPKEDFDKYPRTLPEDVARLKDSGCDLVFAPNAPEMYPPGFSTVIRVAGISAGFEGHFRPGHFNGVATIVAKLLLQALPDFAVFGEKDWQQLAVIRRLVADLDIPVQIVGAPTLREADGLAMSSRNRFLGEREREIAPALHRRLQAAAAEIRRHPAAVAAILADQREGLFADGFARIDYFDLVDPDSLKPLKKYAGRGRLLAAAILGETRLIDNLAV